MAASLAIKMPNFGHKGAVAAIAPDVDISRESILRGLLSYNKERLLRALNQVRTGGPGYAETLNVAHQVARLTTNSDPEVATAAITCLGLMGHKAAPHEQLLEALLSNGNASVRAAAVESWGRLGIFFSNMEAVAPSAKDADATVRAKFCAAAAIMEATSLHESVSALLSDSVPEVQGAAIEALGGFLVVSQEMQSIYGEKVAEVLGKMLEKPRTRAPALDTIAMMGEQAPAACLSAVVGALADGDIFTRASAVAAYGVLTSAAATSKDAVLKVKEGLTSENAGVRAAAACALATMGDAALSSADALEKLLADSAEDASGAAYVVGNGARRPPPQMRRPKCAAVTALARVGGAKRLAKISEALNDANWEVRLSAAEALGTLGAEAKSEVNALLGSMEDDAFPVRAMCCFALGQTRDSEAIPRLVDALEDPAFSVRLYALQALAELGEAAEEHSHEIFKLTEDDNATNVRAAALRTLAKLGSTGQNYAGVVASMLTDADAEVRAAACEALAGMGDAGRAYAEELEELMGDLPAVRAAAVFALESMGLFVSPMRKDWGRGPGVATDKPAILMPGEINLEGLGLYLGDIMQKKQDLVAGGKWIEGVL